MITTPPEELAAASYDVLVFGSFRLYPVQHVLLEDGKPLRIGSRALEILLALAEQAGETVDTSDLRRRISGNSVVESSTLRVHIAALRKILGDRNSGIRYVENVSGRGYRFAAPVIRLREGSPSSVASDPTLTVVSGESASTPYRADNLPAPQTRMVGRAQVLSTLAAQVPLRRLVTLTGPGGIGKTTLALSVAQNLAPSFTHGVCFVDLAVLTESRRVPGAMASALGLAALAADPRPSILTFLADKSMLVVLDNCEHVIEVAASVAEEMLQQAPRVHVLATSREPLRARNEFVHRLEPLATPESDEAMTHMEALAVPALQLFVERAQALGTFELRDADVPFLVEICHRLEGNPLAIELAAAHVGLLGLRGLASSLDQGVHLQIKGRRTASPRHQTLRATLDWSYELLSAAEQQILRRLAVFVGSFDLESACAVAAEEPMTAAEMFDSLANLVAKSLLAADVTGEKVLYRLLDMPRAYALEKLRGGDELVKIQQRHAHMWCTSGAQEIRAQRGACWLTVVSRRIDDLRSALQWCFSPSSDVSVGTRLALASLWFELVLEAEYGGDPEWAPPVLQGRPGSNAGAAPAAARARALAHHQESTVTRAPRGVL